MSYPLEAEAKGLSVFVAFGCVSVVKTPFGRVKLHKVLTNGDPIEIG